MAHPFESVKKTLPSGKASFFDFNYDPRVERLPRTVRILLECAIRNCDGFLVTKDDVATILDWEKTQTKQEIPFRPARVVMQDFTGVPAVVDLAAMRDCVERLGGNASTINPNVPVDLVIDHSVQVDASRDPKAQEINETKEFTRNAERFTFLKWGSTAFDGLRIVPPGNGIVHQVNLEYLARVVFEKDGLAYPDTLVGTDSHTTMINGLGCLGWGVGGIEAEAAMLGQPMSMLLPAVVGVKVIGTLPPGATATDAVLTVTAQLRKLGVVGKFVEFFGPGVASLSLADRATISNMAPEYGATCGFFPVDEAAIAYMLQTGRSQDQTDLVREYLKAVGLFADAATDAEKEARMAFSQVETLDLGGIVPCIAGPKRPQDYVAVASQKEDFAACVANPETNFKGFGVGAERASAKGALSFEGKDYDLEHGSIVIAAITSCTNTSNPGVLIAAGLVAQAAIQKGLKVRPYIKTSLSPGSQAVEGYLKACNLLGPLEDQGFAIAGYGCMTCIGNSGDLYPGVGEAFHRSKLIASAVLSGNRNFEARVHPDTAANYLASPPLVVAYALAGTMNIDLATEPLGEGTDGPVYLRDIWPTNEEIETLIRRSVTADVFSAVFSRITQGNERWDGLKVPADKTRFEWDDKSTYIHNPPFFASMGLKPEPRTAIEGARCLLKFGDSITTDHISPAGDIHKTSAAAAYLAARGLAKIDFNTYGARRGNDEVMARGTFANMRLPNRLVGAGTTGPVTVHHPTGEQLSVFDASAKYIDEKTPLVVLAGKEYGSGSSRDWAAKGPNLLGIQAVIAESYERIHRSNLVGMGIVPLCFKPGESWASLGLQGDETFRIALTDTMKPGDLIPVFANDKQFEAVLRIDTDAEMTYYRHGGILRYVIRKKLGAV